MAIRFAAARGCAKPAIDTAICRSAPLSAGNDNADRKCAPGTIELSIVNRAPSAEGVRKAANDEAMLGEALRHFARHGLSAAEHARRNAQAANLNGDAASCSWWIEICRRLDRRMAARFEKRLAKPA